MFIMVHGRPEKKWTYNSLRRQGYTGKIFLVADDLDETVTEYRKMYGDELLVFDKQAAARDVDAGDNTGDLRSTLFAVNTIGELARKQGMKHYAIMCDDYKGFYYKYDQRLKYKERKVGNLDSVFKALLKFYEGTNALTVAMAQNGDFLGGKDSPRGWASKVMLHRKAMNTFFCSVDRPFKFVGRLNEDVNTYVLLGGRGKLFLTVPNVAIIQHPSQQQEGGLTDVYRDYGTYIKSLFAVMYNPSCVSIRSMGYKQKRLHHRVHWPTAVPKVLAGAA